MKKQRGRAYMAWRTRREENRRRGEREGRLRVVFETAGILCAKSPRSLPLPLIHFSPGFSISCLVDLLAQFHDQEIARPILAW
eukprot:765633-Hanusia_phi.AAC.2